MSCTYKNEKRMYQMFSHFFQLASLSLQVDTPAFPCWHKTSFQRNLSNGCRLLPYSVPAFRRSEKHDNSDSLGCILLLLPDPLICTLSLPGFCLELSLRLVYRRERCYSRSGVEKKFRHASAAKALAIFDLDQQTPRFETANIKRAERNMD